MKTYRTIIDITAPTNPKDWNWDNFLNLDGEETFSIISIEEGKK